MFLCFPLYVAVRRVCCTGWWQLKITKTSMHGKAPGFYSPTLAAAPHLCLPTWQLWGKGNYIPQRAAAHSSSQDCDGAILVPLDGSVGRTVIFQCPLGPDLSHPKSAAATRPPLSLSGLGVGRPAQSGLRGCACLFRCQALGGSISPLACGDGSGV